MIIDNLTLMGILAAVPIVIFVGVAWFKDR